MKKALLRFLLCLLLCVLFLGALPLSAAPDADSENELIITMEDGEILLTSDREAATFWEEPQLRAGETRLAGRLIISNDTGEDIAVALARIELPYHDAAAMEYLNALRLTVLGDSEQPLFDDTYVKAAESGTGLQIIIPELAAGDSRIFTIALSCSYGYTGTALNTSVPWQFLAASSAGVTTDKTDLPWVLTVVVIAGGVVVASALLAVVMSLLDKRKR